MSRCLKILMLLGLALLPCGGVSAAEDAAPKKIEVQAEKIFRAAADYLQARDSSYALMASADWRARSRRSAARHRSPSVSRNDDAHDGSRWPYRGAGVGGGTNSGAPA